MELTLLSPGAHDWFEPDDHFGVRSHWIVEAAPDARVQLCEMDVAGSAASHVHELEQQVFHVMAGKLEVTDGSGTDVVVRAGQSLLIPAGVPHATRNEGSEVCRYLVVTSRSSDAT